MTSVMRALLMLHSAARSYIIPLLLIETARYSTIAELSEPMLRLAGRGARLVAPLNFREW